ncbi:MAG TPA: type II secretion system protein GspM [Kofleriaceae bacterium]|nr:type II secretion system protein GspM [Kofleriaceae bacterium]
MPAAVERAKDWWEGKAPRERRLIAVLGATAIICILAWVAITIRGGLRAIEQRNQEARDALAAIDRHRVTQASQAAQKPAIKIPATALSLDSYLDPIIKEVGLESPTYPGAKEVQKGANTEISIKVTLKELTIYQLKDLLEKIESQNQPVAVTELHIKKNFRDPEKLDVDFTVVTFYKKKGAGSSGSKTGATGGSAAGAGSGQ